MAKRSYFNEITEIKSTWDEVEISTSTLHGFNPSKYTGTTFCIGSGGALCLAGLWQLACETRDHNIAKTLTPFEFYHTEANPDVVVLFSASGKNHDILQVFRIAIARGCMVLVFTATPNSKLVKMTKEVPDLAHAIYPSNKVPKDGFLAVNSTVAICHLIVQLDGIFRGDMPDNRCDPISLAISNHQKQPRLEIAPGDTFQIIASEWGKPAGLDFEARMAESSIAPCFLTDPRNFGHGRFMWLEKWKEHSKLIVFHSDVSKSLITRLINSIPEDSSYYVIKSPLSGLLGSVYCIIRSILLLGDLAGQSSIDPGKPIVPSWGKKIHRLRYNFKVDGDEIIKSSPVDNNKIYPAQFQEFSQIVLDFDGTLIDTSNRFSDLSAEIIYEIERLASIGLRFGISTGRGSSAHKTLKRQIKSKYHDKILLGLYNGTLLSTLDADLPNNDFNVWPIKKLIDSIIRETISDINNVSSKCTQISIRNIYGKEKDDLIRHVKNILGLSVKFIQIKESGHSVDILPHWATKLSVVHAISDFDKSATLCIGDQGQIGGNDEELLMCVPSISVGSKQPLSVHCLWLGKDISLRESKGTHFVLKNIHKKGSFFNFELNK